jgi:two-component system phosphate regulon sensor histidine kinase PhoR
MSITGRLVLGSILLVILATIAALIHGERRAVRRLESSLGQTLAREALLVRDALPADSAELQPTVERLGRQLGRRITVVARNGQVIAESEEPSEIIPNIGSHSDRPEILAALAGRTGTATRHSATINQDLVYVAVPGGPGAVRLSSPIDESDALLSSVGGAVVRGTLIPLLLGVLLAFLVARTIAGPLQGATLATRAVAAEQIPRFPRSSVSDVDDLVRALRDMHEKLEQRLSGLRHERAETAALVEAMVEGVIAADERGQTVTANAAARRMLGYGDDDALPALPQLFRAKAAREAVTAVLEGEAVVERELELDGQNVLLSARPLPTGGALLVLHDVSDLRRLEMVRRDFVANVSHELKTPLTSISGYAETLVSDHADPETTRRFLDVILANSRRMQQLVDALLDLSRIESGAWQPNPVPVDAATLGRECWSLLDSRGKSGSRFSTDVEPGAERVYADPDALRHILTNLLDNASRYAHSGGQVTLRLRREGAGIRLSVRDTGSGIAAEHLPRIFERFYRADSSRSREMGGTGLGLAIVKHLVEGHDGHVDATSQVGVGTEISCWFPDQSAPEAVTGS